jgi:hypothetical protein
MRTHDPRRGLWARTALLLAGGSMGFAACGGATSDGGGSGETHFLVCRVGCEAVGGYRVREAEACVQPSRSPEVACVCGDVGHAKRCRVRLSDRTAWLLPETEIEDPSAWGACSTAQSEAAAVGCDFVGCERRPRSACSAEDFCAGGRCGGLEFDEAGCWRMDCTSDADCPEAERCTALGCEASVFTECGYTREGRCQCGGPLIACGTGEVCAPVALAGPRGDWVALTVDVGTGPCPQADCSRRWTFYPDGSVESVREGVPMTATMLGHELSELRTLVDGAELRLAFRDGIPCDGPPTDIGVSMTVSLSTGDISRDVTGCAVSGPEGNVFQRLYEIANRY